MAHSDRLARLVKGTILVDAQSRRVAAIDFWIRVAQRCFSSQNASSGCAIVAALSSADVSRLEHTWKGVSNSHNQWLCQAKKYIDPQGNHRHMRAFLRDAGGPCIPFVGRSLPS